MTPTRLETTDGVLLEARWDVPDTATGAVVLCHPHPQQGGTMNAPLLVAVTHRLVSAGFAVLRFNFRGVGRSTGAWDHGDGELHDIEAAVAAAGDRFPEQALGIAGWSFGAATSLRWLGESGAALPWVGIAPPVENPLTPILPGPSELADTRRTFIIGDRDQFTAVADLSAYVKQVGGTVEVVQGSDHFFYFREERVAELVVAGFEPHSE